jgi:hypothetical protein
MAVIVNQEFNEEVTVLVWRNINRLGFIPTGHFGHAALMLRGPSLGLGQGEYEYVSWWPGEGAGKEDAFRNQPGEKSDQYIEDMYNELSERARTQLEDGTYQPRGGQTQFHLGGDTYWGVQADAITSVPALRATNQLFGLDLARMWSWYQSYQTNNGTYRLASKTQSCSGVAAAALVEGGGEAFVNAPTARIYMEPRQVDEYGVSLKNAILEFNRKVTAFEGPATQTVNRAASVGQHGGVTGFYAAGDIWDEATWKRQSAVGGSMRSSTLRKIDRRVTEYWRRTWGLDFKKKYRALVRVLEAVMEHRIAKPQSARSTPICQLGLQVIDVVRDGHM